jgi:hypothetical protein
VCGENVLPAALPPAAPPSGSKEIAELGACAEERSDGALAPNYEISLQPPPQGQSIEQFVQA